MKWGTIASAAYTPADTADYPGTDPTTIGAALDNLAARVKDLEDA